MKPFGPRSASTLALATAWFCASLATSWAWTQTLPAVPEGSNVDRPFLCPAPNEALPPPSSEAEAAERKRREAYRDVFPAYVAAAGPVRATHLLVPVDGVRVAQIADTWGAPRGGGRRHEGQDLFAASGTPVRAAAPGFVWRIGERTLGGLTVTVVGGGGVRYYYAHLSAYGGIREGDPVVVDDVLGYVGNTGNAVSTPPHLHFGAYVSDDPDDPCAWDAVDPLPLLVDR